MKSERLKSLVVPLVSFLLAIIISGVIMALCGYNPFSAYSIILSGAFGSPRSITNTLIQASPLIMTGLGYMVSKKATLINLGIEGQLYIGALCAALVGMSDLHLPMVLHLLVTMLSGIAAGGLAGLFIGWLKVRFGSNEVITTTMTNFVIINFTSYLVNYPLKADGSVAQTERMLDTALMPKIFSSYQLTWSIVIIALVAIAVKFFIDRTKLGFEIQCVGLNQKASSVAGIKVGRVMLLAMFLSGAIGGLAGALQVMSVNRRFIAGFSADYGFSGIAVAALGNDNAIGIVLSGIVFGALKSGATVLNMSSRTPTEFVAVVQALVVIFVSAPLLINEILSIGRRKDSRKKKEVTA